MTTSSSHFRSFVVCAAIGVLGFAAAASAQQGDRQLLRTGVGDAYVMLMLDTSGSMNWAPKCTAQQVADGICNYFCPEGDCPVPRDADDPASKFRQAKEALYEVLQDVGGIHFGFATFNQDSLRIQYKEWLYRVAAVQSGGFATLDSGAIYPVAGTDEVFGATFACDRGNNDANIGCYAYNDYAADTNDIWEMTKVRRLPKLGVAQSDTVVYYIRDAGQVYRVQVDPPTSGSQSFGDPTMTVRTRVYRCTGTPSDNPSDRCDDSSEYTQLANGDHTIEYTKVGDFVKWDYGVDRAVQQGGYDGVQWSSVSNSCDGWDPNDDTTSDAYSNYDLRFPTTGLTYNPPGTANDGLFSVGDVIPLDWNNDNKAAILNRLAPRLNGGDPATDPEAFAVATYLNNNRNSGEAYLRLKNENLRPLIPNGSTPLGYALGSMRSWYRGCLNGTCPGATGWDDIAAEQDPNWQCRKRFLIVITDGDDTCPGRDPCSLTASMHALDDITTYVVAFGVQNTAGNRLNCMASNGGSGAPIYPQNKQELVDALNEIFGQIQESTVSFASAAVPTVQANIADKVYLSSFVPLNNEAVWPGRLDAFLKPLPLDDNNFPDRTQVCQAGVLESRCYAWDAGDSQPAWDGEANYNPRGLLLQAPLESDITHFNNSSLKIGNGPDERRVFFGLPNSTVTGKRQLFQYPDIGTSEGDPRPEQLNYEFAWNLPAPLGSDANRNTIAGIIDFTLKQKRGEIDNPDDPTNPFHIQYVMGDIFHSNPLVINAPSNFEFYTSDLYWNTPLCGQTLAQTQSRGPQISYSWFSNKNLCRRIMLAVGSDDGQMHVFDGGTFEGTDCKLNLPAGAPDRNNNADDDGTEGAYNWGSGREIFSFIPNAMMPVVKELSQITELTTQYGVDGSPRTADVFIDPVLASDGTATCTDRQWRTLLMGGYREGGPGIYALDVTQPDTIDTGTNVPDPLNTSPKYVPSCIDGGLGCGPLPFPALRWEFTDRDSVGFPADLDVNGFPDLAESWSRPVVSRIKVCNGDCDPTEVPEDRYVAIFGGGLPAHPTNSAADVSGNWLYILDIETGKLLYKRGGEGTTSPIVGSVAADVAAVDSNVDGLVDTLYFGTTAGYVYKVALGNGPFATDADGMIKDPTGEEGLYDPFQIFTTNGKPIYLEVNAIFVPRLNATALLFGTGNRWNLWSFGNGDGRFYAIVDQNWQDTNLDGVVDSVCAGCPYPLDETKFFQLLPDDPNTNVNYLYGDAGASYLPGWYLALPADDRLITEPFSLGGVTFFTVFSPIHSEVNNVCAFGGESKIFTVNTVTAAGYAVPAGSTLRVRYITAPAFTTQPFVESSATKNIPSSSTANTADQWTDALRQINADLRKLAPRGARFANYTLNIQTIRSDTGIVFIAPVPVAIQPHDWKEF